MEIKKKITLIILPYSTQWIKADFSAMGEVRWLFLSSDYRKLRLVEDSFGLNFKRIDISKLLEETSERLRGPYTFWIDKLNKINGKELEWWFTGISSRNPYESDLFQNLCYMKVLEGLCLPGTQVPDFIIVDSIGLARTIKDWAKKKGIEIKFSREVPEAILKLGASLSFTLKWLKYIMIALLYLFCASVTSWLFGKKKVDIGGAIIINTYLLPNSIDDESIFCDNYFPYLHDYLARKGYKTVIFPFFYGIKLEAFSLFKRLRLSKSLFLIPQDYLRIHDYLYALTYPFRFLMMRIQTYPFEGFLTSPIIIEEQKTKFNSTLLNAIFVHRFFSRLKNNMADPSKVIVWHENQAVQKAFIAGCRKVFPNTRIIGAQLFLHSPNLLNLFLSESEVEHLLAPDLILTTSDYETGLSQLYSKSVPCVTAAALRYSHIFEDTALTKINRNHIQPTILSLLPIDLEDSIELLENLKMILKEVSANVRVIIKNHPSYKMQQLLTAFGKEQWPARFESYTGTVEEILGVTDVVVGTNSTSMIEAAVKGIPVIFMGRQTALNNNIFKNMDSRMISHCYNRAELIGAINYYLNLGNENREELRKAGAFIREKYFNPVNDDTLLPFIEN